MGVPPLSYEGGTPIPGPKEGVGGIALKKLVGGVGYLSILGEGVPLCLKRGPSPMTAAGKICIQTITSREAQVAQVQSRGGSPPSCADRWGWGPGLPEKRRGGRGIPIFFERGIPLLPSFRNFLVTAVSPWETVVGLVEPRGRNPPSLPDGGGCHHALKGGGAPPMDLVRCRAGYSVMHDHARWRVPVFSVFF